MKTILIKTFFLINCSFCFAQIHVSDQWHLTANSRENYNGVSMANGQFGIVTDDTPLRHKEVILGGVYEASPENGISRIVRGIEFLNLRLKINNKEVTGQNISNWQQTIDMKQGISTTSFNRVTSAMLQFKGIYTGGCAQYHAS